MHTFAPHRDARIVYKKRCPVNPFPAKNIGETNAGKKHPKNNTAVDKGLVSMLFFLSNTETLEAKVKPEGTPTESGER